MDRLPPELQTLILKRLDYATLMKFRRVSRQWKRMIEQKSVLSEIFVHFPLPDFNTSSLLPFPNNGRAGKEYPKLRRFGDALYNMCASLDIHRIKRITITTNCPPGDKEFSVHELLVIWTMPHSQPDIFDVVRFENAVISCKTWLDVLDMEYASRSLYYPPDMILPKPMFSMELVNIYIDGMFSPAYDFDCLGRVGAWIKSLTIPGNLDYPQKFFLFERAFRACFQPLSMDVCAELQEFCEGYPFQDAKACGLYETAFQFVEKPEQETEEAQMQRWETLNISALEPVTQALIEDYMRALDYASWVESQ